MSFSPRSQISAVLAGGICLVAAPASLWAQSSLEAVGTPLTAWLDLRAAAPDAAPQTVPSWVESFEFVAAARAPAAHPGLPQLDFSGTDAAAAEQAPAQVDFSGASPTTRGANAPQVDFSGSTPATEHPGLPALDFRPAAAAPAPAADVAATPEVTDTAPRSVFRIRLTRPADATDDLQVRVFFDDRATGPRPRVTAWNELGQRLLRSRALGQGLGLPSSETVTVPMTGVNYLEIEAADDGTQVRSVFMTWLDRAEVRQAADFATGSTVREPFQILNSSKHGAKGDSYLFGVVTAGLQKAPLVLKPGTAPSAAFEFPLERAPLVAVLTCQVLGADIAAPPSLTVNGHPAEACSLYYPDLADPGYLGNARESNPALSFRYTGWLRVQKVIPGEWLLAGLNTLTLALSNGSDAVAVRSVEVQLKYNWDKFDYVLSPAASTPVP